MCRATLVPLRRQLDRRSSCSLRNDVGVGLGHGLLIVRLAVKALLEPWISGPFYDLSHEIIIVT